MKIFSIMAILFLGFVLNIHAATFTVTRNDDRNLICVSGVDCSLREALTSPDPGGEKIVNFILSYPAVINLTLGELSVTDSVTINGPGARNLTIQRSSSVTSGFRIFSIANGTHTSLFTVNINGLTINGGRSSYGGAINLANSNWLNLNEVSFISNYAEIQGGAIYSNGNLTARNSLFHNNSSGSNSSAIYCSKFSDCAVTNTSITSNRSYAGAAVVNDGKMTLTSVTISHNISEFDFLQFLAVGLAGGENNLYTNVRNSIIAKNTAATVTAVDANNYNSQGNNLIEKGNVANNGVNNDLIGSAENPVDPKLDILQNNGGPTDTRALLAGSPAIDAGNNCIATVTCPSSNPILPLLTDQRGFARIVDGDRNGIATTDIGAYEFQQTTAATVTLSGRASMQSGRGIASVSISITNSTGNVRMATTDSLGFYNFGNVITGETYVLSASDSRYIFAQPSQVLSVNDEGNEVNFIALPTPKSRKRVRFF